MVPIIDVSLTIEILCAEPFEATFTGGLGGSRLVFVIKRMYSVINLES